MSVDARQALPWRRPGPDRPPLPLPPARMPMLEGARLRKRWRYIGVYGEELMLCAARAQIGPLEQSFWAVWDRRGRRQLDHTVLRPGSREVVVEEDELRIEAGRVRARLTLGPAEPVEAICPSGSGWGWTRKRAGLTVEGTVELDGVPHQLRGRGVDDESAGYHRRHTSWRWSAGVGRTPDGSAVAWNLVEGVNDPPRSSERSIWVDGVPSEPAAVSFDGLGAVRFADGSQLRFTAESERSRRDNLLLIRSRYTHRFGSFAGELEGLHLAEGLGVMEDHSAVW